MGAFAVAAGDERGRGDALRSRAEDGGGVGALAVAVEEVRRRGAIGGGAGTRAVAVGDGRRRGKVGGGMKLDDAELVDAVACPGASNTDMP